MKLSDLLLTRDPGRLGRLCRALVTTRLRLAGGDIAHLARRAKFFHKRPWIDRLAAVQNAGLLCESITLPPQLIPSAHLHRLSKAFQETSAPISYTQLAGALEPLFAIGVQHLYPLLNRAADPPTIVEEHEFLALFPSAGSKQLQALRAIHKWFCNHPTSFRALLEATTSERSALAALYPLCSGAQATLAPNARPPPMHSPLTGSAYASLRLLTETETDVLVARHPAGNSFRCIGFRNPQCMGQQTEFLITHERDTKESLRSTSSAFWCPSTPALAQWPPILHFNESCKFPPPVLGHPLRTRPLCSGDFKISKR